VHRYPTSSSTPSRNKLYAYRGVENGYIHHGQFSSSFYNIKEKGTFQKKIVIHQKIPCFVVTDDWNTYSNGYGGTKQYEGNTIKKIDSNTLEIVRKLSKVSGAEQTTRLGDYIRVKSVNSPRFAKSKLVFGSSKQCLKEPNEETWTVYWWLKNPASNKSEWVKVATEKMR
jgi:hypothetical protein